jgi:two-component system sensor histidine kinase BaeS
MFRSITTRLILAFFLIGITVVALASGITWWLTAREFQQFTSNQALDRFSTEMRYYYQTHGNWQGVNEYYQQRSSMLFRSNPPPGLPDAPGMENRLRPRAFSAALAGEDARILIPAEDLQIGDLVPAAILARGSAIVVDGVTVGTALVIGNPPPFGGLEQQYLTRANLALVYAALGGLALALVLGIVLARALTHPIRDLTSAIHSMAAGDFKQQVAIRSKDELGQLAAAFNQMSSELDRLQSARRRMTADIAHDLRNPLTVIGGYVESMREGVLAPTLERLDAVQLEVKHLERLVDDLRTLSQAEAGELRLNREPVALGDLLARLVRSYQPLAEKQSITLRAEVGEDLPEILVDPDRIAQVLGNLMSNSLRYTPANGRITLAARHSANTITLLVQDTGRGIAPEALSFVFDRFYRADSSRSRADESGLGLAIARSIVEAHGGTISAESTPGSGTTIKITLPL